MSYKLLDKKEKKNVINMMMQISKYTNNNFYVNETEVPNRIIIAFRKPTEKQATIILEKLAKDIKEDNYSVF